jgi:hypothetical protein
MIKRIAMLRLATRVAPFVLVALLVACTSTPAGPTNTAAGTEAAPTASAQPAAVDPTAPPSFRVDNELAGRFPTMIDGQPVTGLTMGFYMDALRGFAPEKAHDVGAALSSLGIDAEAISIATAWATLGGERARFAALRVPGGDASAIVENYDTIGVVLDPDQAQTTLTDVRIDGKDVTRATEPDGDVTYIYADGEVLWIMALDKSRAAKILAVLP